MGSGPTNPTLYVSLSISPLFFSSLDPVVSNATAGDSRRLGPSWPPPWCRARLSTPLYPPVQFDFYLELPCGQTILIPNPRVWGDAVVVVVAAVCCGGAPRLQA